MEDLNDKFYFNSFVASEEVCHEILKMYLTERDNRISVIAEKYNLKYNQVSSIINKYFDYLKETKFKEHFQDESNED